MTNTMRIRGERRQERPRVGPLARWLCAPSSHPRVLRVARANGDPCLLAKKVTMRGEVFTGWRVGRGSYLLFFSSSSSSSLPCPKYLVSEGVSSPRTLMAAPVALQVHLLCLCACCYSLLAWLASCLTASSGRVPPRSATRIPKILHKNTYALKKQKLTQLDECELEQTHPGAVEPFP
jgi:hypothetical protein